MESWYTFDQTLRINRKRKYIHKYMYTSTLTESAQISLLTHKFDARFFFHRHKTCQSSVLFCRTDIARNHKKKNRLPQRLLGMRWLPLLCSTCSSNAAHGVCTCFARRGCISRRCTATHCNRRLHTATHCRGYVSRVWAMGRYIYTYYIHMCVCLYVCMCVVHLYTGYRLMDVGRFTTSARSFVCSCY